MQFLLNAQSFENEILKSRQGLRFENIGELKIISSTHRLTFNINFTEVESLMNEIESTLINSIAQIKSDSKNINYLEKLERMSKVLNQLREIFNDVFGIRKKTIKKRSISIPFEDLINFNIFSTNSGDDLAQNLKMIVNGMNSASMYLENLKSEFKDSIEIQKSTNEELEKQVKLNEIAIKIYMVKSKIRGILTLQQRARLSSMFVSITEFNDTLNEIQNISNENDEELPFSQVNEYFFNLKTFHSVEGKILKLSVEVPKVEKINRKLYKIHEIPSSDGENLIITDVKWKYIAVGDENVMMLESIDPCLKAVKPNTYLCTPQSPLISKNAKSECLVQALQLQSIEVNSCETSGVKFKQLTFIRLGNGEYFYYSPNRNNNIKITCDSKIQTLTLEKNTGILKLEKGCSVETDKFKIISTKTFKKSIYKSFNVGYTGKTIDQLKASLQIPEYLNDVQEDFRKIADSIHMFNDPLTASFNWILYGLLIALGLGILIFIIIRLKFKVSKEDNDNVKFVDKDLSDY